MKKKLMTISKKLWELFRKKKTKPFVYVAIGDSTVEGIGATHANKSFAGRTFAFLKQYKKNVAYYNFGKAFATVKDVLDQQMPQAITKNPDLVVIAVGANDIKCKTSTQIFERRYEKLLQALKTQTNAVVIVNTIPDVSSLHIVPHIVRLYYKWVVQQFNNRIHRQASQTGASVVDIYKKSHDVKKLYKNYKDLLFQDGIHPSDHGYALWAESIIQQISPLVM